MVDKLAGTPSKSRISFFDGENEDEGWGRSSWITDGHKEIAKFLHRLKTHGNVKVCMASRELNVFEHEFKGFSRVAVHEHTAGSINKFCRDRLTQETPELVDLEEFVSTITEKSRGVFLWVRLVVDNLVDGYINGNSKDELQATLKSVPQRLGGRDGLYMHMMQNVRLEYLSESRRLFQLISRWSDINHNYDPLDIITLFAAEEWHLEGDSQQELRVKSDEFQFRTWAQLQPQWSEQEKRLKSRCGGLLEGDRDSAVYASNRQAIPITEVLVGKDLPKRRWIRWRSRHGPRFAQWISSTPEMLCGGRAHPQ